MGACSFCVKQRGASMSKAYTEAVKDAKEEFGNDSYNGKISTTNGVTDKTSEYKRSNLSLNEFINKHTYDAGKWGNSLGICVKVPTPNANKIKSVVSHIVGKGTKKWVLKYVVYSSRSDREIGKRNTKGEAVKLARQHTETTQERTFVTMEKILEKGDTIVARIDYKGSSNEQLGEYIFFGMAAV